jgi:hypothetical protein
MDFEVGAMHWTKIIQKNGIVKLQLIISNTESIPQKVMTSHIK